MLIRAQELRTIWRVRPRKILHVGAHLAEELDDYIACGWGSDWIVWVDANPNTRTSLERRIGHHAQSHAVQALLWHAAGIELELKVTNNGQSSSALDLKEHLDFYPDIHVVQMVKMFTRTAEDLLGELRLSAPDLINLDVQGAELEVLRGMESSLGSVRWIYSEVNVRELYAGCADFSLLDSWLAARGFVLVDWSVLKEGWGDALWVRARDLPKSASARRRLRLILAPPIRFLQRGQNYVRRRIAGTQGNLA